MRNLILVPIIAVIMFSLNCSKSKNRFSPEQEAAINSATGWLELIDEGQYSQSWQIASPSFQSDVTERQWVIGLENMRTPYGGVLSRKIKTCNLSDYDSKAGYHKKAVAEFQTTFKNQNTVKEFVTLEYAGDSWQVSVYYLDR